MPQSREERAAYFRRYYAEHREEMLAKDALRYIAHRDKICAYKKRHRAEHPELYKQQEVKRAEAKKRYYSEHREHIRARNARYRAEHRDELNAKNRLRYAKHPEVGRNGHLKRKYGITLAEWKQIFKRQGNRCAICRSPKPNGSGYWATDHKAGTNIVRGILCNPCNTSLGQLGENVRTMREMIKYARKHDSSRVRTRHRSFIGLARGAQ